MFKHSPKRVMTARRMKRSAMKLVARQLQGARAVIAVVRVFHAWHRDEQRRFDPRQAAP